MNNNREIIDGCFKYIVPFRFKKNFEDVLSIVESKVVKRQKNEVQQWHYVVKTDEECDLYDYISKEFLNQKNTLDNILGYRLKLEKEDIKYEGISLANNSLKYYEDGLEKSVEDEKTPIEFSIKDVELWLCKNGIGFFVYGIKIKNIEKLGLDELELFQNSIKEFNHRESKVWLKRYQIVFGRKKNNIENKINTDFFAANYRNIYTSGKYYDFKIKNGNIDAIIEIVPFAFGRWINQCLSGIEPVFFASKKEIKVDFPKMNLDLLRISKNKIKNSLNNDEYKFIEKLELSVEIIDKICKYISGGPVLNDWANFLQTQNENKNQQINIIALGKTIDSIVQDSKNDYMEKIVPDKALLFTGCIIKNYPIVECGVQDRNMANITWLLAKGYKRTYHFHENYISQMCTPFKETMIYAAQEGVAYICWPQADNLEQFKSDVLKSMELEYYLLYMKVLYQSYSLLLYAEKISEVLPAVAKYSDDMTIKVSNLFAEINHFLVKSMATSVSHIHHHSDFYVYLKQQLRIHDDVKSVTAGLNSLELVLRKENERREEQQENQKKAAIKARQVENDKKEREREAATKARQDKLELYERQKDKKIQAGVGLMAMLGVFSALADGYEFFSKITGIDKELPELMQTLEFKVVSFTLIVGVIVAWYAIKACKEAFSLNWGKIYIYLLGLCWLYVTLGQILMVKIR